MPHELASLVPLTIVPVQTILLEGQREYAMFSDLQNRYHWVLPPYVYASKEQLLSNLDNAVVAPAERKAAQLDRK